MKLCNTKTKKKTVYGEVDLFESFPFGLANGKITGGISF